MTLLINDKLFEGIDEDIDEYLVNVKTSFLNGSHAQFYKEKNEILLTVGFEPTSGFPSTS